mmetsp:Transcript_19034/g.44748  ORF Transcript_19034/g.44748 Transcript_19034/m.44748 type:complete len:345 (-) Transcript_19034:3-1037(-)
MHFLGSKARHVPQERTQLLGVVDAVPRSGWLRANLDSEKVLRSTREHGLVRLVVTSSKHCPKGAVLRFVFLADVPHDLALGDTAAGNLHSLMTKRDLDALEGPTVLLAQPLYQLYKDSCHVLAQGLVGNPPEVPHESRRLLLLKATACALDKLLYGWSDQGLPVSSSCRAPDLEAAGNPALVLGYECQALVHAKVRVEKVRVAAADDVHEQVLAGAEGRQQRLNLFGGLRHLRPLLELAQRAIVVQEDCLHLTIAAGPELLLLRQVQITDVQSRRWPRIFLAARQHTLKRLVRGFSVPLTVHVKLRWEAPCMHGVVPHGAGVYCRSHTAEQAKTPSRGCRSQKS